MPSSTSTPPEDWEAAEVHRLRHYLGDTQAEFAYRLGTRQQTVSEWETGSSRPRRMARRLLHLVAEERGFYSAGEGAPASPGGGAAEESGQPPHAEAVVEGDDELDGRSDE
ncbi:MAG: hypothetical protein U0360_07715 [Dehalococcoidia bacterium]